MTAREPCERNAHNPATCLAARAVDAYNNMKVVMMVGDVIEHVTAWDRMERAHNRPYRVVKVRPTCPRA